MPEKKPWDNASPEQWNKLRDNVIFRPPGGGSSGRGGGGGGDRNYRAAMEIGTVVVVTLGWFILAELRRIRKAL
jgi:hypothetical protein